MPHQLHQVRSEKQILSHFLFTNKIADYATLKVLLLQPSSPLLSAYINSFLKDDDSQKYLDVLLHYYDSHNLLPHLLLSLASFEIKSTNICNPLFRGNTLFSRIYSLYLTEYCSFFLTETSKALLNFLSAIHYDDKINNQEDISVIITTYFSLISDSFKYIPQELLWVLHCIYQKVLISRGKSDAMISINTLFFLRYLFIPFKETPSLFKIIQSQISSIFLHLQTVEHNEQTKPIVDLIDCILNKIYCITSPHSTHPKMFDSSSDNELLFILRSNKDLILSNYEGDPCDLSSLFSQHETSTVPINSHSDK
ncbi:Ras GTPase-activating protein, putative [Entamoeba histolytica HM-3:IMSS]|uniref:Ras GTPase-activating protein, putative n=2 Tax=Entamoeba histolytica TaxID=5759 RepID=M2RSW8_ENTHI|nr:Ras GTPase-activating protein, putative [Entamoeba histolytica KU27]EMS11778.1 Ras GTPase-activating protein, putative [Entamoeba histolytica HM-3:IMSS]